MNAASPARPLFRPELLPPTADGASAAIDAVIAGSTVEPRAYQRRIAAAAVSMFAGTHRTRPDDEPVPATSVLIESPTGSGKTVMGLSIAAAIQRATGARVGWVAMRRNLLSQALEENARAGFGLDFTPISMFDKDPPAVDLLVVDEAQHDAAASMANLHCRTRPTFTLGLSATPYRTDRIKLCFDRVIRDAGIATLIADGYLSPYHHYTVPRYTPEVVAGLLSSDPDRWGSSLAFFHRRDECVDLAERLRAVDIPCDVVTATSPREQQLAAFEAGETRVLINMAILVEGFDCPTLKTVFCRPSGKGCTIQMAGRVLRRDRNQPFKQIVQCSETRHPMSKTAAPAEQYLWSPTGWRSLRANRHLDEITRRSLARIAATPVELPPIVRAHRTGTGGWWRDRQVET
ncbi:MAG: DEAD/DEAH box helicase family protein [Myxococcota bacterium]